MKTRTAASALGLVATTAHAQDPAGTLPDAVVQVAPALESYAQNDVFGSVWTDETLSMRDRARHLRRADDAARDRGS